MTYIYHLLTQKFFSYQKHLKVFGNTVLLDKTLYPLHVTEDSFMIVCLILLITLNVKQTKLFLSCGKASGNLLNETVNSRNDNSSNTRLD